MNIILFQFSPHHLHSSRALPCTFSQGGNQTHDPEVASTMWFWVSHTHNKTLKTLNDVNVSKLPHQCQKTADKWASVISPSFLRQTARIWAETSQNHRPNICFIQDIRIQPKSLQTHSTTETQHLNYSVLSLSYALVHFPSLSTQHWEPNWKHFYIAVFL